MPIVQQYAESGVEYLIPYAKKKLLELHDYMAHSGVGAFNKRIDASDGSAIYLSSRLLGGQFTDRIRIIGGATWACADPVQPLWGINSALLPSTHATWAPTIQHIQDVYLERPRSLTSTDGTVVVIDSEKAVKHTLVVCRYTRRVAEHSWDEVWSFDDATFVATNVAGYNKTGQYVSNDDTNVSLVDIHSDESEYNARDVAHGLLPAAAANPWGWYGEGTAPVEPIPPVNDQWAVSTIAPTSATFTGRWDYVTTWAIRDSAGDIQSSIGTTGMYGSVTGGAIDDIQFSGEAWPTDFGAARIIISGTKYWNVVFGTSPTYAGLLVTADAHNVIAQAQYIVAVGVFINQVLALLRGVAAMLDSKLATDGAEITPHPSLPYKDQMASYVFPPQTTVALTATYDGVVVPFELTCDYKILTALGGSLCGVAIAPVTGTAAPPYSSVFQPAVKYTFAPAAKIFTLATTPKLAYTKAYFSSGVDVTKLESTTTAAIGWGGIYRVRSGGLSALLAQNDIPDAGGIDPGVRMKAMCVGLPSFGDVSYAAFSAIFTKRGAAYRQTDHTYTAGGYTVIQPAIPNTDAP